jgi:arylsulfatase A-like enzyme/Flp pilus assembly protein TadD
MIAGLYFLHPAMTATLRLAAAAVLASAAAGWMLSCSRAASFERRADQNVLLVTIDTLRADVLSSYGPFDGAQGRGTARTPNLDALAAHGMLFDFAHAHAVLTRPSHASILSGLYPFEHGVRDHSGYRMKPDTPTLATLLKAKGFATGAFVGGVPLARQFGLDAGFDVYDDHFARPGPASDFSLAERPAGEVVSAALQWIGGQQARWFAWVHVFDPHAPYAPPPPFDKEYAGRPYYGEVAYVDQALGPLFEAASRGPRKTTILVTGDHGEGLGDHGELGHGLFAYESTLRVPLIVAQAPSPGARAIVSHASVRHIDVVPTLLDAVEVAVPSSLPGRSLLPGATPVEDRDVTSYFEAMSAMLNRGWAPLQGVLAGREKFVDLPRPELYDLAADSVEKTNLVDSRTDRRRALAIRLADFHAAPPGDRASEAPEDAVKLQALGYTSGSAPRKAKYTEDDDPKTLVQLDQWIQQGIDAWQQHRRAEALAIYRKVVVARPSMAIGYKNLAFLQWQSGDAMGAIDTLQRAFRADAVEPAMVAQLGSYLAEAGRPADAIALLEPLAAATPADPEALNSLGIAYARAGNAARATAAFERVLAAVPGNVQAYENLGTLAMQRNDPAAAERYLGRAVALNPGSARAHNGLGVIAMKAGRRDEAFAHWKQAVALAPSDFDALFNLAMELDAAGRRDEARPYLERFATEAPPAQYAADVARARKLLGR